MTQNSLFTPTDLAGGTTSTSPLDSGALQVLGALRELPYTHSFFPYPAKFPAQPVRDFLARYSHPGDRVLDPFCGSGTVLVESILHDRDACGLELNPVAALVAQAKATIYRREVLDELHQVDAFLNEAQRYPQQWVERNLCGEDVPTYKNVAHWFQPLMLIELAALRKTVCRSERWSEATRPLLWMAFLKLIVPLSNQDTETRYAAVKKPLMPPGFAITKLRQTLADYYLALSRAQSATRDVRATATVHEGDTLQVLPSLPREHFDLAITSPPYINTFDYYLYHKHRIFWLDRDPQEIRRREVGCHHRVDAMSYDKAVGEYRTYLESVLRGVHDVLRTRSRFAVLIGDGIVKGQLLLADELMRDIAAATDFEVESIESSSLREVSRRFIKDERLDRKSHHIVVLRK